MINDIDRGKSNFTPKFLKERFREKLDTDRTQNIHGDVHILLNHFVRMCGAWALNNGALLGEKWSKTWIFILSIRRI